MDNGLYVSCHAPSLSLLLFETVRSAHDQRGLLIGEVCKEIISEKTDDNEMNREQRTTIYLEHCVPVKDNDLFGRIGNVNKQKLQKYIDQYCGKIVGWYSFRRNTRINSRTLNEIITHKSLIHSIHHMRPEHFVGAFLSASTAANYSTHIYNHLFMRYEPMRGVFEPLKLKIYTMSDKIISVNGYSIRNTFPTSKMFEDIISPTHREEANPVMSVLTINEAISENLKVINRQLQEAEKSRYELEQEIKSLKKRLMLDKLQEIKFGEIDSEPEPPQIQYMRYNANINYNPDRKENPLKIITIYNTPRVPEEFDEVQCSNQPEMKKHTFSKHPPGFKTSSKNGSPGRAQNNPGNHSSRFESEAREESSLTDLNHPDGSAMERASVGNNHVRMGDAGPECDRNEQFVVQSEKSKATGPV